LTGGRKTVQRERGISVEGRRQRREVRKREEHRMKERNSSVTYDEKNRIGKGPPKRKK